MNVLNYRVMMRKKGKTLQILTTQCVSMDDAVKAGLGVAHAESIEEMEEMCIHEYGPGNVVRMLDVVTGIVEVTSERSPPKDTPKPGQVIKKSDTREAVTEEMVDAFIAKYSTGDLSKGEASKVAPLTQVKVRKYTLVQLACTEPPEKKGYGGRNG